jgi:pimeloyl-ACP methyl ester carboxylesterase
MGEGDDVVLCLHGWPQHWYEWRALMPALADRHRVIALDQRGFGWSEATPRGYEKEELASDALAVLDALGLERVKLVGHDWGGWIGFQLALRAPERIDRYLALNILPPFVERRATVPHLWRFWYQWLVASPFLGERLHTKGALVPKVLVGASVRREVWDAATIAIFADRFRIPERARAAVQMYRTFSLREAPRIFAGRYRGARLEVPTRVLFGTGDPALRPEAMAGWRRHAADMELELVDGCGHFTADEAPYLVAARAREFFS